MTDREKAIVMAYTGVAMLTGDKLQIFHKYVEKIMGRPIWTHEMAQLADEIKEKSKDDFLALCADENSNKWIPVSESLPEDVGTYLVTLEYKEHGKGITTLWYHGKEIGWDVFLSVAYVVVAWMPLPKPYRVESEGKK